VARRFREHLAASLARFLGWGPPRISLFFAILADLGRRPGSGSVSVSGSPSSGRAERRWRANRREADTLTGLKAQMAATGAKGSAVEVEATPIRYVATLFGGTAEQAIRLLILLMVLTCDPLAIALTAAAAASRRRDGA
jgi:hypothetical protein